DELAKEIASASAKFPDWTAGKALLGLIKARTAKFDEARALLRPVLALKPDEQALYYPDWVIGSELENYPETRDLAREFYEQSTKDKTQGGNGNMNYDFSPLKRLVTLYLADNRKDDARALLIEA